MQSEIFVMCSQQVLNVLQNLFKGLRSQDLWWFSGFPLPYNWKKKKITKQGWKNDLQESL